MLCVFLTLHTYFKWLYTDKTDDEYLVKEESDTSALLKYLPFGEVIVAEILDANVPKMVIDNRSVNLQFPMLRFILLTNMILKNNSSACGLSIWENILKMITQTQ